MPFQLPAQAGQRLNLPKLRNQRPPRRADSTERVSLTSWNGTSSLCGIADTALLGSPLALTQTKLCEGAASPSARRISLSSHHAGSTVANRVEPVVSSNAGPPDRLIGLARKIAAEHHLYPELVCAICEQESAWDPWAIRYEPAFHKRYVEPLWLKAAVRTETEAQARAISWGLMQVMGQTAREHGFLGRFLSELCDPALALEIGCRVLALKLAAARGNVEKALLLWNGGANSDYPRQVLARAEKYK